MTSVLIQLFLMGINLFAAKSQQEKGRNPGFQYFVAGFCCMGAVNALVRLFM